MLLIRPNLDIHIISRKSQQIIRLESQPCRELSCCCCNQHDRKLSKLKRGIDDDCIVVATMGGLIIIIITWTMPHTNFPLMVLFFSNFLLVQLSFKNFLKIHITICLNYISVFYENYVNEISIRKPRSEMKLL